MKQTNHSTPRAFSLVGIFALVALLLTSFGQPAKADHRWTTSENIVETLAADGRFSTLIAAVSAAGLADTLAEGGPFTLFAPTDDAFAALPEGTVETLLEDPEGALTQILLYHVVGSSESIRSLLRASTVDTLQGNPVLVVREGLRKLLVNNNEIQGVKYASNGRIYVSSGVLLPPDPDVEVNSLVDVLQLDGRFGTLLAAVGAAGLGETLATGGPFTLFAPTDDAFAALPEGTVEALLEDPTGQLTDILLYHVLGGRKYSWNLLFHRSPETLLGVDVKISYGRGFLRVNDSRIVNPNISTPNAVVHVIDAVLLPPPAATSLMDTLRNDRRFSTLVTALEVTGLDAAVESGESLTIFAPTERAFSRLPEGTLETLLAEPDFVTLKQILLYHVLGDAKTASELIESGSEETLQGSSVRIQKYWWFVFVNRSLVLDANIKAPNGIVHAIGSVLLPPTE